MNRFRLNFLLSSLFFVCIAGIMPAFSQAAAQPGYEAILHVVVGSDEPAAAAKLPKNLSALTTILGEHYSFSRYHLANTFIGRVGNTGAIEYKSLTDIFGKSTEVEMPTFLNWNLAGLRSLSGERESVGLQLEQFRFGARVPIRMQHTSEDGKTSGTMVYEPVGLTVNRLVLPENRPTMIGTISLPKTNGTVFLVLTIRRAVS